MYQERKAMTRVKYLAAALSVLLVMNPGTAAYADSAPDLAAFNVGQDNKNVVPDRPKQWRKQEPQPQNLPKALPWNRPKHLSLKRLKPLS